MHNKSIGAAVAAVVLSTVSLSTWAQPGPGGHYGGHDRGQRPGQGHGPQYRQPAPPPPPMAHPGAHGHPHGMPPGQAKRMGAGPHHNWHKGSRVPPQYRTHQYVVNDWRGHGLKAPPRGYHWVQNGSDYLLVAIATGVISQLILGY